MPRKKSRVAASAPPSVGRRETLEVLDSQAMMAALGFHRPANPILDVFSGYLGLNYIHTYMHPSHTNGCNGFDDDDDYYDCYDDDDDDDGDDYFSRRVPHSSLEPHPQIRQLTEEEANQHAKELLEEEERRKARAERNKRKKMRKKEKKRLEKESAEKNVLPEDEKDKSDSEDLEENSVNGDNEEANQTPEIVETANLAEALAALGDEICIVNKKEENHVKIHPKQEEEQKDLTLNNSYDRKTKLEPDNPCKQMPGKMVAELLEGSHSEDVKPNFVDERKVKKKKGKPESNKEKPVDPPVDVLSKRSRELAGAGFRLAACGQYEMAVKYFSDAIKYNPKEYKLFGNRSLCYERLQQYDNALSDAELAISMEPNWIKGLFRKGKALCGLKRYYDASLTYKQVLSLDPSSAEAVQELKRAQVLHLVEMGFSQMQSEEALKNHGSLEEAVEALFSRTNEPEDAAVSKAPSSQQLQKADNHAAAAAAAAGDDDDEGAWTVLQPSRPRSKQLREAAAQSQTRSKSHSPTPRSRAEAKRKFISVWVGSVARSVSYATLHELFSRAGTVLGIKMLLDQECAFVNYATEAECDRAIQFFDGLVVEGCPLSVQHPCKSHNGEGLPKAEKECFFFRTIGCTRADCTFKHVPEHENIDRDKFTSGLGNF